MKTIHHSTLSQANQLANRATRNLFPTKEQWREIRDSFLFRIVEREDAKQAKREAFN